MSIQLVYYLTAVYAKKKHGEGSKDDFGVGDFDVAWWKLLSVQ
jgi:hypothetical protein